MCRAGKRAHISCSFQPPPPPKKFPSAQLCCQGGRIICVTWQHAWPDASPQPCQAGDSQFLIDLFFNERFDYESIVMSTLNAMVPHEGHFAGAEVPISAQGPGVLVVSACVVMGTCQPSRGLPSSPGLSLNRKNSIAFGKSTSQSIYSKQHTPKIGYKLHKYGLKHALHSLDDHFT